MDGLVMTMTRGRWLIVLAVLIVAVAGVGVYSLIPPEPGVTVENFGRLHKGMTRGQVEAILGPGEEVERIFAGGPNRGYALIYHCVWVGNEGHRIDIEFM